MYLCYLFLSLYSGTDEEIVKEMMDEAREKLARKARSSRSVKTKYSTRPLTALGTVLVQF